MKLKTAIRIFANIVLMGFAIPMTAMAIYAKGALIYYYEPAMHILVIEIILGLFAVSVSVQYVFEKVAQVAKERMREWAIGEMEVREKMILARH